MRLEIIQAIVVCAAYALRGQNCELDSDIATVLQRCGSDALGLQVEALRTLVSSDRSDV
jgi:hypothetical protein